MDQRQIAEDYRFYHTQLGYRIGGRKVEDFPPTPQPGRYLAPNDQPVGIWRDPREGKLRLRIGGDKAPIWHENEEEFIAFSVSAWRHCKPLSKDEYDQLIKPKDESNPSKRSEPQAERNPHAESEPKNEGTPRKNSGPSPLSNPPRSSEPDRIRTPIRESEPSGERPPQKKSEPHQERNPALNSEPEKCSNPLEGSEPSNGSHPDPMSVPGLARNPDTGSAPSNHRNPVTASEPHGQSNPLPTSGHNQPPSEGSLEDITQRVNDLTRDAYKLIHAGAAATKTTADTAADLANMLTKLSQLADTKRKDEQREWREQIGTSNARWYPVRDVATDTSTNLKKIVIDPYLSLIEKTLLAEKEAQAKLGMPVHPEEMERKVTAGTRGRHVSRRTVVEVKITDYAAALNHYKDHPEIKIVVLKLATRSANIGVAVPGVEIVKGKVSV